MYVRKYIYTNTYTHAYIMLYYVHACVVCSNGEMVIKKRYPKIVTNRFQCHFFYHGSHTKLSNIETAAPR